VGLREISPGHRFAACDDAGFQWPAADLTTVAREQPGLARLWPLPILLPEEVPRQITKAEVIWHQTRITARWRITLAGLKLGDQFSKRVLINDWREHQRAGRPASHATDSVDLTAAASHKAMCTVTPASRQMRLHCWADFAQQRLSVFGVCHLGHQPAGRSWQSG
jgi:hypothetical protein